MPERSASLVFYNDIEAFYQDVKQGMHVDILVSDIEMPVMNGFQLAENMHIWKVGPFDHGIISITRGQR